MKRILVAALAATGMLSAPAAAQDWGSLRDVLIETAAESFGTEDYRYSGFAHESALADGDSEDVTIRLGAGLEFIIIGACDGDCSDFDLTLYDSSGDVVDTDLEVDDFPIVRASPTSDGVYRLNVSMAVCSSNPCNYVIQPFVK